MRRIVWSEAEAWVAQAKERKEISQMKVKEKEVTAHTERQYSGAPLATEASNALWLDVVNMIYASIIASDARIIASSFRVIMPPLPVKNRVKKPVVLVRKLMLLVKNAVFGADIQRSMTSQDAANELKKSEQFAALSLPDCFGEKILSPVKDSSKILSPPDSIRLNHIRVYFVSYADIHHSMMR